VKAQPDLSYDYKSECVCFSLPILWAFSSDNHPSVYLAKFGNIQNMKVEKS